MNDPEAGGRQATRRRDDSDTDSDSSSSTGGGGGGRHHGVTETLELLSKNRTLDMKTGYRLLFFFNAPSILFNLPPSFTPLPQPC